MSVAALIDVDRHWLPQAATELHAYRRMLALHRHLEGAVYVAFPWSALIEPLVAGEPVPAELQESYRQLCTRARQAADAGPLITVCEHLQAKRYSSLFKACGIRHVFWPHSTITEPEWLGLEWHPFPLVPGLQRQEPGTARTHLACYVHDPALGAASSRIGEALVHLAASSGNELIVVQSEQVPGDAAAEQALAAAVFSVCPAHQGRNNVRLWQSLMLGTIPVILADDLALPGPLQPWIEACVFLEEASTAEAVLAAVRRQADRGEAELEGRRALLRELAQRHGPDLFVGEILRLFGAAEAADQARPACPLLILDPGLKGLGSHHHRINALLAADGRFAPLLVACHQQLAEALPAMAYALKPAFTRSVYDDHANLSEQAYAELVASFLRSIAACLAEQEQPVQLWIHTPCPALLQALAHALETSPSGDGEARPLPLRGIGIDLMFGPDTEPGAGCGEGTALAERSAAALTLLSRHCRQLRIPLTLHASNPVFAEAYRELLKAELGDALAIGVHPHVLATGQPLQASERSETILLHSGDPRPGKGLEWLAAGLAGWLPALQPGLRIALHLGELRYPEAHPALREAIAVLRDLAQREPERLLLREGYLDDTTWQALLGQVRYAALLHDPAFYGRKTSGNWFDLLPHQAAGLRLLLTRHTLTSRLLAEQGLEASQVEYGDDAGLQAYLAQPERILPLAGQAGLAPLLQWAHGTSYADHVAAVCSA